jgi:hypothetical protein
MKTSLYLILKERCNAASACVFIVSLLCLLATSRVAGAETTLISTGSVWKYWDHGNFPGSSWKNPGFSDSAWSSGPAILGYGSGNVATVVNCGPDNNCSAGDNHFITTYFRRGFQLTSLSGIDNLRARLLRDDGAVVYLNGVEVFRSNMPAGEILYTTPASAAVFGADELTFHVTQLNPALLVAGNNVIAVEIHQTGPNSSDTSFDFELVAESVSGSDGSYGPMNITANNTLNLPSDGIFRCTTITIAAGATLSFTRNGLNTPVYLLATGDVQIFGTIDVSGSAGTATLGGSGGPGGFDGGTPSGSGLGPGGGKPGHSGPPNDPGFVGSGSYATQNPSISVANAGEVYGSPLLVPLVGGSGGGGQPTFAGHGGGGALVIASNTRIELASGGGLLANGVGFAGAGSGGAIRLVAPIVTGFGQVSATSSFGGAGRVRIDTIDRTGLSLTTHGNYSLGSFMTVFPPGPAARLDIIEAAGTTIPEGANAPVSITLPFGSDPNRNIVVQARNLGGVVPVEVVLTPNTGPAIKVQAQINNAAANPATVSVPVTFPINTPVTVNAWIR